ncbi:MAG TPA: hypothetical protein VHE10_00305 [Candidatus Paceibacterota bacterium]|nr:hypothetical protein [Candidatus Paceibacterota bacterium]
MTIYQSLLDFTLQTALPETFRWVAYFAVFWVPALLIEYAWNVWVAYVRLAWVLKQKKTVLEIKLPQETYKSPAAMELVLNSLIQTGGEGTVIERYWEGKARPWCSLELCSIDGEIRFFIWCFDGQKNFLVANIYASYPDVAIHEVEDYTEKVALNLDKYDIYCCEYKATKPDPYPIKTYVDYGLSDDPKEEFKVDPLAALIEVMASIKKEDQVWFQFIARAHVAEKNHFNKRQPDPWIVAAKEEIAKIAKDVTEEKDGKKVVHMERLTESQKEAVKAIERSIGKYGLDVGVRGINVIPKGRGGLSVGIIKGSFRPFGSNNLNGLMPMAAEFPYPWQDKDGKKLAEWKKGIFDMYCARSFFHPPYTGAEFPKQKPMILNTEELATLYHFPGSAVKTPGLHRIPSKRADAPHNLPV